MAPTAGLALGDGSNRRKTAALEDDKRAARAKPPEIAEPKWLRELPKAEPTPPRPWRRRARHCPTRRPARRGRRCGDKFKRGRLVHRLLQSLPECHPKTRGRRGGGISAADTWMTPEAGQSWKRRFDAETSPISAPCSDPIQGRGARGRRSGRPGDFGPDRPVVVLPDRVLIIDYKTLRPPPRDPKMVPPAYLHQLAADRAAIRQRSTSERPVDAAILWTDGPILMPIPSALLDLSRVAAQPNLPPARAQ